jgi:large subunit ribosomal protein L15
MNIKFEKLVSSFSKIVTKTKRRGRGIGSGLGKTSGSGHNGQKARAGFSRLRSFEGGQRTIITALPHRGFKNFSSVKNDIVVLDKIVRFIEDGYFDQNEVFSRDHFVEMGIIRKNSKNKIKLILGKNPDIKLPLKFKVDSCSVSVKKLLEENNGAVYLNSSEVNN